MFVYFAETKMPEAIGFFELNTGAKIPSVGLGTWRAEPDLISDAITTAVKVRIHPLLISLNFIQFYQQ